MKQQSSNHQITCNQTKLTLFFFQPNFFRDTKNPSKLGSFPFRKKSHHQTSDQEGGWGEGRAQLLRVLPRNNIGIDVVHVSSLDEGLTWGIHILFFLETHTRKTHDFWTFGQNVWPAKYPRKSADHHHPEGACSFVPATAGNRRNGSNIPSLELSRFSAAIDLFDLLSKQIETKSGSKKSPTVGPTERTPKKPEYLKSLATYLGVRWEGPIQFLMDRRNDGGFQVRFISFFHGGRAVLFREGNLKANCYSNPQGNQAIHGFQSMRCGPRVMVSSYHIHDSSECVCQSHLLRGFFWGLYKRQTGYYHKPLFLDPVLKQPCSNSWRVFWTPGFQLVVQLTWNHQPWKPAVESHLFWSSGGKHLNKLHHFLLVVFSTQYVDQMFIISQFVGLKKYSIWIRLTK